MVQELINAFLTKVSALQKVPPIKLNPQQDSNPWKWGMFENLKLNNLLFQKKILTIPKLSATRNVTLWNSFGGEGVVLGPHLLLHHLLWLKVENKRVLVEIKHLFSSIICN